MIKLVLWDIDGTLVLYRGAGRRAAESAFADIFAIRDVAGMTRGVDFAGATDGRILREMAGACGIEMQQYLAQHGALRDTYFRRLAEELALFPDDPVLPGVRETLELLRSDPHTKLGLLTGNYQSGARMKLESAALFHYFQVGGFGDDHEDRRIVASVARARSSEYHKIDVDPGSVVVVGDTIHDVDCARANGFRSIAVCTGRFDRATLENAGAHHVLTDLREFRTELL